MQKAFSDLVWFFMSSQIDGLYQALNSLATLHLPLEKPIKNVCQEIKKLEVQIQTMKELSYPNLPPELPEAFQAAQDLVLNKNYTHELDKHYLSDLKKNPLALALKAFQNKHHLHQLEEILCKKSILSRSNESDRYLIGLKFKQALNRKRDVQKDR